MCSTPTALIFDVASLLKQQHATIAVAESCTGGLISHWLTSQPGCSGYFLYSAVTYSNASKQKILQVPAIEIEREGVVSENVVKSMAQGVRDIAGATYGLSTSGIAGPAGGTEEKPVGTLWIGLASPWLVQAHHFSITDEGREKNKAAFATLSLQQLKLMLLQHPLPKR